MPEVVLDGVSKVFPGGVRALSDFHLSLERGELVVLVGPSGSGKTTVLRLIAGLERPTAGRVLLRDRDATDWPPHRRDVALVFQRPALYPHLTVEQNLGFGLRQRLGWWRRRAVAARVSEVAGVLGIADLLGRRPAQLSGGQQQRVALGRAMARAPTVFLLDEPLSSLEPAARLEMRRELHLLQRQLRATMLYVTHDQEEALTLADRVVVLDRGLVQQADRPDALYERPANRFVAGFLGWPPINLLGGELREDQGRLCLAGEGATLPLPDGLTSWRAFLGRSVTVGLRPEHVRPGQREGEGLTMDVRDVERLGPGCLVGLQYGPWALRARWPADALAGPSTSSVRAVLALEHAHLFDGLTGAALAHGRPDG
jgi:multiple sugar transport system ATP-binding protein